ncbi:hypothetical protein COOONC_24753 [Cooperia oncophora]
MSNAFLFRSTVWEERSTKAKAHKRDLLNPVLNPLTQRRFLPCFLIMSTFNCRFLYLEVEAFLDLILCNNKSAIRNLELSAPLGSSDNAVITLDLKFLFVQPELCSDMISRAGTTSVSTISTPLNTSGLLAIADIDKAKTLAGSLLESMFRNMESLGAI